MLDYYDGETTVYGLVRDLFCGLAIGYFLWELHRIGRGLMLAARVDAYDELADAYTPEERELLIHRVKHDSLARI